MKSGFSILGFLLCFLCSCKEYTCDDFANDYKNDEVFHFKLLEKQIENRTLIFTGIDLNTHKKIVYFDDNTFTYQIFNQFKIGDTVIKDKGKYQIVIIRKGKKIIIPYECDKLYQN